VKIALLGYGKMGLEIEKIAAQRQHQIVHTFTSNNPPDIERLKDADVVIEFTRPGVCVPNLKLCFAAGVPAVCGTTGWYSEFEHVKIACAQKNGALFTATNFSLGVNITFFINRMLAKMMAKQNGYAAGITEIHHTRKLDAPSGTAITLAEGIIENNDRFNGWVLAENLAETGSLPINALREGDVPGTHVVQYNSSIDRIELKHEAQNRSGFALGAVLAAEWIFGKKGIFGMQDMLNFDALIK
jgi:4-hydroxy-tetrahydrodipicolinate reductase